MANPIARLFTDRTSHPRLHWRALEGMLQKVTDLFMRSQQCPHSIMHLPVNATGALEKCGAFSRRQTERLGEHFHILIGGIVHTTDRNSQIARFQRRSRPRDSISITSANQAINTRRDSGRKILKKNGRVGCHHVTGENLHHDERVNMNF